MGKARVVKEIKRNEGYTKIEVEEIEINDETVQEIIHKLIEEHGDRKDKKVGVEAVIGVIAILALLLSLLSC